MAKKNAQEKQDWDGMARAITSLPAMWEEAAKYNKNSSPAEIFRRCGEELTQVLQGDFSCLKPYGMEVQHGN